MQKYKEREASRSSSPTIGETSFVSIYLSLDRSQLSILLNWFIQANTTVIQNVFLERHLKVTAVIHINVRATIFCHHCKLTSLLLTFPKCTCHATLA